MAKHATEEDRELLRELGVDITPVAKGGRSLREQRIIAGFEEIERFFDENGHVPRHGETLDIFERMYAVRLDSIRASAECRAVLAGLDTRGLLVSAVGDAEKECDDRELLASLGVEPNSADDITQLVHVRSREEIRAAEEIAQRNPCADFDEFRPVFAQVQRDLDSGDRETLKYKDNAEVRKGDLFILDGQKIIVADVGEPFVSEFGRPDRRLRVVYDNGTESDLLVRSLQRALNKDKTSRRITQPDFGPLFSEVPDETDMATGCVYVLRSESDHPFIAQHRELIHKIGITGGDVKRRIANAKKDPTYLLADVTIVATYTLANIKRRTLETVLQRLFHEVRLDFELKDRFGSHVEPREWYLLPLGAIDEAMEKIKCGTNMGFRYDPRTATMVDT